MGNACIAIGEVKWNVFKIPNIARLESIEMEDLHSEEYSVAMFEVSINGSLSESS